MSGTFPSPQRTPQVAVESPAQLFLPSCNNLGRAALCSLEIPPAPKARCRQYGNDHDLRLTPMHCYRTIAFLTIK